MARTHTAVRRRARRSRPAAARRGRNNNAKISTPEDLFKHELKDIYTGEHLLMGALKKLAGESTNPKVSQAFEKHRAETARHIERLETIGAMVGENLRPKECPGIEGLIKEKQTFMKHRPTKEMVQMFNIGAGQKSERYEITAYEGLIDLARKLGMQSAVSPLQANLSEEEGALRMLKTLQPI